MHADLVRSQHTCKEKGSIGKGREWEKEGKSAESLKKSQWPQFEA